MKNVTLSFALVTLMFLSSVASAQCSSCGQQASAAPVIFAQPVVAQPVAVEAVTYAQPAAASCNSCGTADVATFSADPVVTNYAAPIETSFVSESAGCSSCGQAVSYTAPVANPCCCGTQSSRGGLLRGGRGGVLSSSVSSRLIRGGIFSAIRD